MKQNMGSIDRLFRAVIAAIIAWVYFSGTVTGTWGIVLLAVGGVFLLTSLIGFCPLYTIFGLNTCKHKPETK